MSQKEASHNFVKKKNSTCGTNITLAFYFFIFVVGEKKL